MQAESWTSTTRRSGAHPNLVGQIFFPLNESTLDDRDRSVMNSLAADFARALLARRVELSFVGHADQRGSEGYNESLGAERARIVQEHMDGRLRRHRFYSSWEGTSSGEEGSAQGNISEERMAEDRRVDIFSTYVRNPLITVDQTRITGQVPMVLRIVRRRFARFNCNNTFRNPRSSADSSDILSQLRRLLGSGGEYEQYIDGSEVGHPQVRRYPANHRVNRVRIERTAWYSGGIAECHGGETTVWYTWGEPRERVTVTTHVLNTVNDRRVCDSTTRQFLTRSEADSLPFVFPPDP